MDISAAIRLFDQDARVAAVYLLGSAMKDDRLRPDSDVDLALLPMPGFTLTPADLIEMSAQLSESLRRPVDLGVMSSRNLVYAWQALLGGQRVFSRDTSHVELMTASLLGQYARFEDDRLEVVRAYSA